MQLVGASLLAIQAARFIRHTASSFNREQGVMCQ